MSACPSCANSVEGGHYCGCRRNGSGLLFIAHDLARLILYRLVIEYLNGIADNSHLEGLEINLSNCLLLCKRSNAALVTVSFLIVKSKVLYKGIHTLLCRTVYLCSAKNAGNKCILGIILKVSTCEGSSVNIHTGAVPSNGFGVKSILCNASAHFLCQLYVPSAGKHILCGPGHSSKTLANRH